MAQPLNTTRQLKQVALTYVTHRYFLAGALLVSLVIVAPNLVQLSAHHELTPDAAGGVMFALGIPLLFIAGFLVAHVKTQFAHSRARLTPNFAPPHFAVLAACLLLLLVAYPALLAWCAHAQPAGFIAFALAVATPAIWGTHRSRVSLFLVALIVFYSLITDWGLHWWILDSAKHWYYHVAIIATGIVVLAAWLRRLAELREEMPDYQNNRSWRVARPGGAEVVEQRRAVAAQVCRSPLITRISDAWLARLPILSDRNVPIRLPRLLRYGSGAWPAEIQALVTGLMIGAATIFMADFAFWARGAEAGSLNILIFFATYMPGFQAGQSLAQRRPRVAAELVRPLTRRQLVDGLFAAAAWDSIVYWLIVNALLLLVAWHVLGGRLDSATIASYAFISIAAAFMMWGFSLRVAVWTSAFKRLVVMLSPWTLAAFIGSATMARGGLDVWPISSVSLSVAVVLIAIGVAFAVSARRAWLNLELG